MSSKREAALVALEAALLAMPDDNVIRRDNGDGQAVPKSGALITISDGTLDPEAVMSPLSYDITHTVPITVDAVERSDVDAAMLAIAGALAADRTLGGAVDCAEVGPPEVEPVKPEAGPNTPLPPFIGGQVSVTLEYNAPTPVG